MNARRECRLGLLVESPTVSRYVLDLLDALVARADVRLGTVFVCAPTRRFSRAPPSSWRGATIAGVATAWLRLEVALLRTIGRFSGTVSRQAGHVRTGRGDVSQRFERTIAIGPGSTPPPSVRADVDLVVVLGGSLPAQAHRWIGAAEVIRLELGGTAALASPLVGFLEADGGCDRTAVRLYRVARDGRRDVCLVDGMNRTRPLFSLNQAAIWGRGISLVLAHLANRGGDRAAGRCVSSEAGDAGTADAPSIGRLLAYPVRAMARVAGAAMSGLRGARHWSVAFAASDTVAPEPGRGFTVVPAPQGTWWADPVLYRHAATGGLYCFVEEFDVGAGRAHISVLGHGEQGWRRLGVALKEPFHLSFPFVFDYQGGIYMCPETSAAGGIFVYRCTAFPLVWTRVATLMTGLSATDTVLFEHGQRWWMLTNIDRAPNPDHQSELHAFHADSPLSDHWSPVPGNPVKVDCHGARNGGLLVEGSTICRVGQVQSFAMYGRALDVYRITRLDESRFEEEPIARITPAPGGSVAGVHTYSRVAGQTAVDLAEPRSLQDAGSARRRLYLSCETVEPGPVRRSV